MPGNVAYASVTAGTVLPYALAASFTIVREWPIRMSEPTPDGRDTRAVIEGAIVGRHAWALARRLTLAQWSGLLAFYAARKGGQEPFYFYPLQADHDATGVSTTGRYTVRFDGALGHTYPLGRQAAQFRLVEIS